MGKTYHCVVLPEDRYGEWTTLVESTATGSIYNTPEYLDALASVAGGRFRILAVEKGEELIGGVAAYEEHGPGGAYVSPRLLLYYNGFVLRERTSRYPHEETSEWLNVLGLLEEQLSSRGYGKVALKSLPAVSDLRLMQGRGWRVWPTYSYVVPVSDLDATWTRMDGNLRRLVRRAEAAGVTVSEDDDTESFVRLHRETMDRKGRASYLPDDGFEQYVRRLQGRGLATLFHARLESGETVATALVLLGRHAVAHTVSAAALAEHQSIGINPLLRWKSFESLRDRGFSGVDLTDASLNPVTRFKSQLGGDLVMSLECESRWSLRYAGWSRARHVYHKAVGAAGAVVRRSMRRGAGNQ